MKQINETRIAFKSLQSCLFTIIQTASAAIKLLRV